MRPEGCACVCVAVPVSNLLQPPTLLSSPQCTHLYTALYPNTTSSTSLPQPLWSGPLIPHSEGSASLCGNAVPVSNNHSLALHSQSTHPPPLPFPHSQYYVPLCLNLSGSVLFFLTLRGVHVSVAVPVSNGATFAFNAAAGYAFGEKIQPVLAPSPSSPPPPSPTTTPTPTPQYYVPLCLKLSGSVLFFLTLRGVHVSVALP
ncbi:unnamed protein product, partial [Closterium sp. NIES-53]